jgi:hypothetical protein
VIADRGAEQVLELRPLVALLAITEGIRRGTVREEQHEQ